MEEHVGVAVPGRRQQEDGAETGEKAPVAKGAESSGLPGDPDDGREDHDCWQLRHAGERTCHSAPDDRVAIAGQQIGRESPDPEHREADHRRVGDEGAAEKDCRRRDGNQERGAARHSLVPDRIGETVDAGDCRQREHDRHQPADNLALAELPEEHRGDPLQQRELHADDRIAGASPVDHRVEDVERLFREVPGDVGVEDLPPAVGIGHRQLDVLESEVGAEGQNEQQRPVRLQLAPRPSASSADRPDRRGDQCCQARQCEWAEDAQGNCPDAAGRSRPCRPRRHRRQRRAFPRPLPTDLVTAAALEILEGERMRPAWQANLPGLGERHVVAAVVDHLEAIDRQRRAIVRRRRERVVAGLRDDHVPRPHDAKRFRCQLAPRAFDAGR